MTYYEQKLNSIYQNFKFSSSLFLIFYTQKEQTLMIKETLKMNPDFIGTAIYEKQGHEVVNEKYLQQYFKESV